MQTMSLHSAPVHNSGASRLEGLDLLKCLAIMMVVSLHIPLWSIDFIKMPSVSRMFQYAFRLISEGVPFFLVINGFLLFRKDLISIKNHVVKILRLLLLTFFWGSILIFSGYGGTIGNLKIEQFVYYLLDTRLGAKYTGVLWFFINLITVYIMFPILHELYRRNYTVFKYLFIVLSIFTVGIECFELVRDLLAVIFNVQLINKSISFMNRINPFANKWFLFYFCLGGIFNQHIEKIRCQRKMLFLCGGVSWLLAVFYSFSVSFLKNALYPANFNFASVFMVLFVLGLFASCLDYHIKGWLGQLMCSIGRNTLGIYVIHINIIRLVRLLQLPSATFYNRFVMYCGVMVVSYSLSLLLSNFTLTKKFIKL